MKTTHTHGATLHREGCTRVWARYDLTCPRCKELANGATARRGWTSRKADDERHAYEVRAHSCQASGCGIVCTFGQW